MAADHTTWAVSCINYCFFVFIRFKKCYDSFSYVNMGAKDSKPSFISYEDAVKRGTMRVHCWSMCVVGSGINNRSYFICSVGKWVETYSRSVQEMCRCERDGLEFGGFRPWSVVWWSALRGGRMAVSGLRRHQAGHRLQGPTMRDRGPYQGQYRREN